MGSHGKRTKANKGEGILGLNRQYLPEKYKKKQGILVLRFNVLRSGNIGLKAARNRELLNTCSSLLLFSAVAYCMNICRLQSSYKLYPADHCRLPGSPVGWFCFVDRKVIEKL